MPFACRDADAARHSRVRLNANFLCLPGAEIDGDGAVAIVREWLSAAFSGDERIVRELAVIEEIAEVARNGKRGGRGHEKPVKAAPRTPAELHTPPMRVSAPPPVAEPPAPPPIAEPPAPPPAPVAEERPAPPPPDPIEPLAAALSAAEALPAPESAEADEAPVPVLTRVPDISAVLRFLASLKDEDIRLMARRVLEVIRNRFPAAEGDPGPDGFTFTLDGRHVATVIIAKRHIELQVGPDRIPTGRIRDLDGFQHALSMPSVMKAFDALRT